MREDAGILKGLEESSGRMVIFTVVSFGGQCWKLLPWRLQYQISFAYGGGCMCFNLTLLHTLQLRCQGSGLGSHQWAWVSYLWEGLDQGCQLCDSGQVTWALWVSTCPYQWKDTTVTSSQTLSGVEMMCGLTQLLQFLLPTVEDTRPRPQPGWGDQFLQKPVLLPRGWIQDPVWLLRNKG